MSVRGLTGSLDLVRPRKAPGSDAARTGDRPIRAEWPGDEHAIARFLSGDDTGFEQIVQQYSGMVFSLAARLIGPNDAEDVVQETFLRAYSGLSRFRGESSLKTWIYAIALNRIRARRGTLARLREIFVGRKRSDGEDGAPYLSDPVDGGASPEENALRAERRERLQTAMKRLPAEFREAVIFRDLEGLAYEEIAALLSVPIGTVRSRIARGRAHLKEELA